MKKLLAAIIAMALFLSAAAAGTTALNWEDDFKDRAEEIGGKTYDFEYLTCSVWIPDFFNGPDEEYGFVPADGSSGIQKIVILGTAASVIDTIPKVYPDYEEYTVDGGCIRIGLSATDESKTLFGLICYEGEPVCHGLSCIYDISADDEEVKQLYLMIISSIQVRYDFE